VCELGDIINEIKNMGYEFKTLDEYSVQKIKATKLT